MILAVAPTILPYKEESIINGDDSILVEEKEGLFGEGLKVGY